MSPFVTLSLFYRFLSIPTFTRVPRPQPTQKFSPGKKSKQISGDGLTCRDINECRRGARCGGGAVCQNTIGSYKCACRPGFKSKFLNNYISVLIQTIL